MVVEAQRLPYDLLARTAEQLASGVELPAACRLLADAVVNGTEARLAVVRVLDDATELYVARAAAPSDSPLAAESSGSGVTLRGLTERPGVLAFPASVAGRVVGAIELWADEEDVQESGRTFAEFAAALLALVLREHGPASAFGPDSTRVESALRALEAAGETLASGAEADRGAGRAAELAVRATGARAGAIWTESGGALEPIALHGGWPTVELRRARKLVRATVEGRRPLVVEREPEDGSCSVAVRLGQPAVGILVLRGAPELESGELAVLASFAARVSHALR